MYELETDSEAVGDVEGLPASALVAYAEVLSLLEITPWSGQAYNRQRPDGNMRALSFGPDGEGLVVYLILRIRAAWSSFVSCGSSRDRFHVKHAHGRPGLDRCDVQRDLRR